MTALRTYPVRQGDYDHSGNRALWAACRETGITINALIGEARYAAELASIMADYPEVPVTLDHAIHLDISKDDYPAKLEATLGLADFPNMNAKLSFLATGSAEEYPFADMHPATRQIIDAYGPDRCVWGSDYPLELWAPKTTYADYLQLFRSDLGLSAGEQDAILGGTAERLYFSR
jgi:L-fuconolactonase